jgi:hypothetical protein
MTNKTPDMVELWVGEKLVFRAYVPTDASLILEPWYLARLIPPGYSIEDGYWKLNGKTIEEGDE